MAKKKLDGGASVHPPAPAAPVVDALKKTTRPLILISHDHREGKGT